MGQPNRTAKHVVAAYFRVPKEDTEFFHKLQLYKTNRITRIQRRGRGGIKAPSGDVPAERAEWFGIYMEDAWPDYMREKHQKEIEKLYEAQWELTKKMKQQKEEYCNALFQVGEDMMVQREAFKMQMDRDKKKLRRNYCLSFAVITALYIVSAALLAI